MCGCIRGGLMWLVVAGEDGKARDFGRGDRYKVYYTLIFHGHVWVVQGWCDSIYYSVP